SHQSGRQPPRRPAGRPHPPGASRYVTMTGTPTMARTILSFGIILGLVVACAPGRLQDQPSPPAAVTPGAFIPTVPPLPPSPSPRTPVPSPGAGAPGGDISVRAPTQGAEVRSLVRVEGSASVFEGNVQVIIRDARGEPVGRATATASAGAPERGDF